MIYFARIAAAILVGLFLWKLFVENKKTEVRTANSILRDIVLPDGTKVDLNRNSKFKYFEKFRSNQREVFLTGEAYLMLKKSYLLPLL